MYAADDLLDLHRRTHVSLQKLLEHCGGFDAEALSRSLEGFGYPTILLQLHHVIGAERYWIGVLQGTVLDEEPEADFTSIDALKSFRERVASATEAYLRGTTETELRTRREMSMWGGRRAPLAPAQVLLRTQTHIFQHQGQVAAMCRLLGRPIPPGLDFPLGE